MQRTRTQSSPVLADRAAWAAGGAISYLIMRQGVENPDCLSLAAGLVDRSTLPVELVRDAAAGLLAEPDAADALQYGHTAGAATLRMAVLERFATLEGFSTDELAATRGLTAGRVILTNGSQQFLSLVCQILLNPGDICLVAGADLFRDARHDRGRRRAAGADRDRRARRHPPPGWRPPWTCSTPPANSTG